MNNTPLHEVTRTATTWSCTCGKYGVIIAPGMRTHACDEKKN